MKNSPFSIRVAGIIIFFLIAQLTVIAQTTFYIDPTFTGSPQNGSQSNPYNSWSQVNFANGNIYLQKRGTTYTTSGKIFLYQKSNITIGAYGTGNRPIVYSTGGSGTKVVDMGFTQNCIVRDMEIASSGNATTLVYVAGSTSYNNTIDNCILRNAQWGLRATAGFDRLTLTNTEIHTIADDGVFIQDVTNVTISNCNIHDVNMNWYYIGQSQSQAAGDGIQLLGNCNNFQIHNNTIDRSNSGNKFAIIVNSSSSNTATGTITHNNITTPLLAPDGGAGIYLGTGTNILVEHNTIQGQIDGIYNHSGNLKVLGNIFKNLPVGVNTLNSSTVCYISNNTFYNVRTHIKGANINVRNNSFFYTQSGDVAIYRYYPYTMTETNNCYSSGPGGNNSVIGNPLFIDAANGNFRLQSNSPCINQGTSTIMTEDIDNTSVPQNFISDIGAFEYIGNQGQNLPPVILNQTFSINENSANGTIAGTVVANDPNAGQSLTYSITSGNTNNAFTISSSTGILTVANSQALNYELITTFLLSVRVTDNGTGNLWSQATVSVNLININENPVVANQSFTVLQNAANGTIVGTIVATDPDQGQTLSFSITAGNTNNAFAINSSTGRLTVANSNAVVQGSFSLTVRATDNGIPVLFGAATVTITVSAATNLAPVIAPQSFSIIQYSPNGTLVGNVVASDPNAGQILTYSITAGNTGNIFSINSSNGRLSVANSTALSPGIFPLTIRVTDNGSPVLFSQAVIRVIVTTPPNQAPVISNQTFSVVQNSTNGTLVGTVSASDPNQGQTLTYSLTGGNTNSIFVINASNGNLTVANSAALTLQTFALTVRVTDNGSPSLWAQATVTINVVAASNQAPVILNQTFSIVQYAPNGSLIGTVIANDPNPLQSLTYSITGGNTNNAFSIHASSGNLFVNNSTVMTLQTYPLTVRVIDNGTPVLYSQATISVVVTPPANQSPFIANQSFSIIRNAPNGTLVGIVSASDPNPGQSLTYSVTAGNTNGVFAIGSSNGNLTVANSTALNPGSFNLTVRVADNGSPSLWSQATITITVTQQNNQAPVIANQSFTTNENTPSGSVVGTVLASDPNPEQVLTYSITAGNTNNAFSVNSMNGILMVNNSAALNYEDTPQFILTVRVTDNGAGNLWSSATITINLTNVNESPVIENQNFTITENLPNGIRVGYIIASDPDEGQFVTYSIIAGNTNNAFELAAYTGSLGVLNSAALDFETNPVFYLTIRVTDNSTQHLTDQATIAVYLTNKNEPPVVSPAIFNILQYAPIGTIAGVVSASDPDNGQTLVYSILSGNTSNAFAINPANGTITVNNNSALNPNINPTFSLNVRVTDNGSPILYGTGTVVIRVISTKDENSGEILKVSQIKENDFQIYPNPSSDGIFNIKSDAVTESTEIKIYDISGRLLDKSITASDSILTADLSTCQNGVYFIMITSEKVTFTYKVIKN